VWLCLAYIQVPRLASVSDDRQEKPGTKAPATSQGFRRAEARRLIPKSWRFEDRLYILSQRLAEVDAAVDYFEAEGLMAAEGCFVVDPCVGSHFTAPLIPSPVFGGAHQVGANFPLAGGFVDEPAFDEADGAGWVAAVGMGAQADFDKAGECSGFVLRNENGHGERAVHTDAEDRFEFLAMVFDRGLGPQYCAHYC
jgi:hypothetical protein